VKFTGDFRLHEARGSNLSEGGLLLEVEHPIHFPMSVEVGGKPIERMASLVWLRRREDGRTQLGFEFDRPISAAETGTPAD
jgi:hypothetical protein